MKRHSVTIRGRKINQMLREARINAGLSQTEVAKVMGYPNPQYISNVERGLCPPSTQMISVMIRLYQMDGLKVVNQLVRDYEKELRSQVLKGKTKRRSQTTSM